MTERLKVCLILEGSYPYIVGGVAAWVQQLIINLPGIDFVLYTISPKEHQKIVYKLPDNVCFHQDIVISQKMCVRKKQKSQRALFREIKKFHTFFNAPSQINLKDIVGLVPVGSFLYTDAIKNPQGWEMLTNSNQLHNPAYPFADYFWAWKSAHDMMFTILGAEIPEADVYHAVSTGYAGLAGVVAKLRKQKPYMLTEHGLYHKEREIEIKRAAFIQGYQRDMWIGIFNNLSRLSYYYADLIITLFEYNRKKEIELGAPEEKTMVIPNGINIEFFSKVERVPKKGFHVGLVGRVVPIKDVKTFIYVAKIVTASIPDAMFYAIGPVDEDPGYYDDCKLLVKSLQIEKNFSFVGKQDVREYYNFLNVLMLTSIREAQPLVILEAFCCGVPVVSTKVGNVLELLDYDERFLAAPKDAEKLSSCVKYIYNNPKKVIELVEMNKQRVRKFFDRNKVYQRYGEIYKTIKENI
ncbi:MAG: GT4 family glycosyltransferase PelF [Spirochaetales bacterium]|nr:GT4 family glycosyltransferase PelF [Spirochaetales bacterium]